MDSQLPNNISQPPQPVNGNQPPVSLPSPSTNRLHRFLPLFLILAIIIIFISSFLHFSKQQIKSVKKIQSAPLTPTAPPPSPTPNLGQVLITLYPIPTDTTQEKSAPVNRSPIIFTIVAENDTFTPNQITARQGQIITLNFQAKDKTYDIAIPQLGLRRTINAGETKSLEFQAQSFGQFLFACASGCNQTTARGLLTIKP